MRAVALFPSVFPLLLACSPLEGLDTDSAQIEVTASGEAPVFFSYDPLYSSISVTPPVDGIVELGFDYSDPFLQVSFRIDAEQLSEGQRVALPTVADEVLWSVRYGDLDYRSDDPLAAGLIDLEVLVVEESSAALRLSFDATLLSDDGSPLAVNGFVEGSFGDPSAASTPDDDAGVVGDAG